MNTFLIFSAMIGILIWMMFWVWIAIECEKPYVLPLSLVLGSSPIYLFFAYMIAH